MSEKRCPRKDGMCGRPVEYEHACPYESDVNNDDEYTCKCCEQCEHECAMDI